MLLGIAVPTPLARQDAVAVAYELPPIPCTPLWQPPPQHGAAAGRAASALSNAPEPRVLPQLTLIVSPASLAHWGQEEEGVVCTASVVLELGPGEDRVGELGLGGSLGGYFYRHQQG